MIIPKSTAAVSTILSGMPLILLYRIILTHIAVMSFILLVVATCSVPVNENLYLFELRGTALNETSIARVGVLGLCGDFQGR